MDALPLVFSSGWASGVNAYLVVLVLGIADRVNRHRDPRRAAAGGTSWRPPAFLYAMEFIADKIPYIDSTWDAISTASGRPSAPSSAYCSPGTPTSLDQAVLGVVGGGTALLSHLVKAGRRLAINSSPEPITNIGERHRGPRRAAVVWFAIEHPRAAARSPRVLLAGGLALLYFVAQLVRRGWRRWKGKDRLPTATPAP